ncbi:MAG: DNA repair protein RadC [Acetobacteraceae bacterium]
MVTQSEALAPAAPEVADVDALARLLAMVLPGETAPLAQTVIRRFGSYPAALSAPVRELRTVPGLGTHSIAAIKLVHAAAVRLARAGVMDRVVLDNMDRLVAYLTAVLARERIEQFRILFLDGQNRLVGDEAQARGTVNHTPVYPREVVRRALELRAAAIVLVHNHPSGDPTPSAADVEMTNRVAEAAELLGIEVRDHVIIGNGRWFSFRQEELL